MLVRRLLHIIGHAVVVGVTHKSRVVVGTRREGSSSVVTS